MAMLDWPARIAVAAAIVAQARGGFPGPETAVLHRFATLAQVP